MSHDQSNSFYKDKRCIVTGANRGIGLALSESLIAAGAQVLVGCRAPDKATALQALAEKAKGRLQIETLDIKDDASVAAFAKHAPAQVDVLFNNAGINLAIDSDPWSVSPEAMMETFNVNALGPLRVTKALLAPLHQAHKARVANISSIMGSIAENGIGGHTAYRVSKTALNMLNKNFSLHDKKLIFLTMHPGWVQTDMGGRAHAPVTPEESAQGLLQVVAEATLQSSGTFIRFDGQMPAW